jgi:hypothetical protein
MGHRHGVIYSATAFPAVSAAREAERLRTWVHQDRASLVDHPRSSFGVVVKIVKIWLASPLGILPALP